MPSNRICLRLLIGLCVACFSAASLRATPPPAEKVPTFQLRARVTSAGGQAPAADQTFTFQLGEASVSAVANGWSEWLKYDRAQVDAALKAFSPYAEGFPVLSGLAVQTVVDPTLVEIEIKLDEGARTIATKAELYGPSLGLALWRDEQGQPQVGTLADYNQKYWKAVAGVDIPEARRPHRIPITDRFIGNDEDRIAWRDGISNLTRGGFSAIMVPPSKVVRELLAETGVQRTAWAIYCPPGYAFEPEPEPGATKPLQTLDEWAQEQAKPYLDAGFKPDQVAAFAMSDEPGWYYPSAFKDESRPQALTRFHEYLKAQGLKPADVGAASWDGVLPAGKSSAKDLPSKRLFYWSVRFCSWDSARHFANCTRAMEKAFYPGMPIITNWNFFSGRFYVPGGVANNPDKTGPDAAMGGQDWLEFGRMRGGTMLWTEDWFGDNMAYQWSFYCSKLRAAAAKGGVQFGGYVIGRTAGGRQDGVVQKMLAIIGSGGKAIKFYVFGPEYAFPGNCYSENAGLLKKIAEANGLIGAAEELLWPGVRPRPQVAILSPRSAEPWDPVGVSDATNNHLNAATVDYMAEVADLYLALQHANVPVDWVEEDDLSPQGLSAYKVLYVTEPNVPEEAQRGLADWVKAGGTLVTVTGAAAKDRYDEPCGVLSDFTGMQETPRDRALLPSLDAAREVAKVHGGGGDFGAVLARGALTSRSGDVKLRFADSSPAIVQRHIKMGNVVHFSWLPGLSYVKTGTQTKDGLPVGFSDAIRKLITGPLKLAKVRVPVTASAALVETPLLVSDKGAALTALNWTGEPIAKLTLTVRPGFEVKTVESARSGAVPFKKTADGIELSIPLGSVDVLMLKP